MRESLENVALSLSSLSSPRPASARNYVFKGAGRDESVRSACLPVIVCPHKKRMAVCRLLMLREEVLGRRVVKSVPHTNTHTHTAHTHTHTHTL